MNLFASEPEHVLFPLLTEREVDALIRRHGPDKAGQLIRADCQMRRDRINQANLDPVAHMPRPRVWRVARRLIRDSAVRMLVLLGGNRSSKSYCAAYWLMEVALGITARECAQNEGVEFLVVSESQDSSRATAQRIVFSLLPAELKAKNTKKHHTRYLHYSVKEGFSDDILVLESGVQIKFATYGQDPGGWEGRELGLKHRRSLAWWADENMPMPWYTMFKRRGTFRPGWGVWSFTPIHGITPVIKEAVGEGRVRRTRRATQLPVEQVLVPGLRPGRVPFIQDGSDPHTKVCYYHSDLTPFRSGDRSYTELVAETVKGKTRDYILAVFYGFTRDVAGRAWPKYSRQVHQVRVQDLPWEGTNYVFIDPAGGRSWFFLWVRVAPGNPRRLFIYRDWPDKRRHGEWAVPSVRQIGPESRRGRDGDLGPAQRNPGWGISRYKAQMLREETVELDLALEPGKTSGPFKNADPYCRNLANRRLLGAGLVPVREWLNDAGMLECAWTHGDVAQYRQVSTEPIREDIRTRYIDPRAAGQPQEAMRGKKTLVTMFAETDRRGDGEIEAPPMRVVPAFSGRDRDEGIRAVNDLLDYDDQSPVVAMLNEPQLYVADRCEQVDWVLTHYTGEGAEDDGGKDVADLLRYIGTTGDVRHLTPGGQLVTGGFKNGF